FVTPVRQEGRTYWVANFPGPREPWTPRTVPRKRKAAPRRQKKFNSLERAEEFLVEAKREWIRRGGVRLAFDREFHYDAMRAAEILAEVPWSTMEKAALLFKRCVSWREYRGLKFEGPIDRKVELNPRITLAVQEEAKAQDNSLSIAAEGIIGEWLMMKVNKEILGRVESERMEAAALKEMRLLNEELIKERDRFEAALKRVRRERQNAKERLRIHKK